LSAQRSAYKIVSGFSGEGYRSLLRAVGRISSWFGVIEMGSPKYYSDLAQRLLNDLVPYLIDIEQVRSWPGTQTVGLRAETRLLFAATQESVEMLIRSSSCLWDWVNTAYPDDLHFLRQDKSVVLGSTWCTEFAWLELDPQEFKIVRGQLSADVTLANIG